MNVGSTHDAPTLSNELSVTQASYVQHAARTRRSVVRNSLMMVAPSASRLLNEDATERPRRRSSRISCLASGRRKLSDTPTDACGSVHA
jgi:hypothetical protein